MYHEMRWCKKETVLRVSSSRHRQSSSGSSGSCGSGSNSGSGSGRGSSSSRQYFDAPAHIRTMRKAMNAMVNQPIKRSGGYVVKLDDG